jgi:hypothetical protein
MRSFALLLAALFPAAAYLPGVPPQCLAAYQCSFTRTFSGRTVAYNLCPLCRPAGTEYVAVQAGAPSGARYPQIRFNVAGTVSRVVAMFLNRNTSQQLLPFPHSHGIAVQFLNDPDAPGGNPDHIALVDTDTCDQATNPSCGPLNYASCDENNAPIPPASECNPARQAACIASAQAHPFCRPTRNASFAAEDSEVLAFYDGGAPGFSLYDESDPQSGINLTFPAMNSYKMNPFACFNIDPATGDEVLRKVNIFISCDPGVADLAVDGYSEASTCHTLSLRGARSRAARLCHRRRPPRHRLRPRA